MSAIGAATDGKASVENSIQELIALGSPLETASGFVRLGKEYYKTQKDIGGVIAIGEAGAGFCITRAAAASDAEMAISLRTFAKTIAYNAAANCWPGWGDEGVKIEDAHLEAALKLAVLTKQLTHELKLGPKQIGTAHWLVGALELAAGRLPEATIEFETSERTYGLAGHSTQQLMARGYAALACKKNPASSALGAKALADLIKLLREDGATEAIFFADQLATADKIFCRSADT